MMHAAPDDNKLTAAMTLLADLTFPEAPYPGLRPFEESEWPIFFGRERFIDIVVGKLTEQSLLLVHGDSGAGKSSLIKAGVAAQLRQGQVRAGKSWRLAIVRPGDKPMEHLANALANACGMQAESATALLKALAFGRDAAQAIAALMEVSNAAPMCVVIDQFEELFEFSRRHGNLEAERIAQLLTGLVEQRPPGLWFILTMRSEYFGHCAAIPGLAELAGTHQYLLPRMRREDLLRAMQEPARVFAGQLPRALAERMIDETASDADQLPLIQHALAYLHARCQQRLGVRTDTDASINALTPWSISPQDWPEDAKTLRDLVAKQAEELHVLAVQASGLSSKHAERAIEALFRALTDANSEGHAIRRPVAFGELAAIIGVEVDILALLLAPFRALGASFIAPYADAPLDAATRIDISHEALLRSWSRIIDPRSGWLAKEAKDALLWRSLLSQARDEALGSERHRALSPGIAEERQKWLEQRTAAWSERYGGGWDEVKALVGGSVRAAATRRRRDKVIAGALILAVCVILAMVFLWRLYELDKQEQQAVAQQLAQEKALRVQQENQLQQARFENSEIAAKVRLQEIKEVEIQELKNKIAALESAPSITRDNVKALRLALDSATDVLDNDAPSTQQLPARIYIHVADASQKALLERAVTGLAKRTWVVPAIEVRMGPPVQSVLRCFKAKECAGEALRVLSSANALLDQPKLVLEDLSKRYEQSSGVRQRHYEIWFAPGEIRLAASTFQPPRPRAMVPAAAAYPAEAGQ